MNINESIGIMETSLQNKTAVITGGAQGIGYEIADNYLKNGAKIVILLDLVEEVGAAAVERLCAQHGQGRAVFFRCDVTKDLDSIPKKIFDTYKTVDVLVNNAGILNDAAWKATIDINVTALIGWSLKFWDYMRTDKGGKGGTIVNLASIYSFRIDRTMPVYQASKYAVMGFTFSLGHEENFKKSGVRVVAVNPGFTRTNMTTADVKQHDTEFFREGFKEYLKNSPWQEAVSVGRAAAEVFQKAPSGTAWLIEGGKPIVQVK